MEGTTARPKDMTDLETIKNDSSDNSFFNTIGVVVDLMPPTTTSRGQYLFTFKLVDKRLISSLDGRHGVTVRFFKTNQSELPAVRNSGDVVLLRQIKSTRYQGQLVLLAHFSTTFLVFHHAAIPSPSFLISIQKGQLESHGTPSEKAKLTLQEQAYIVQLSADLKHLVDSGSSTDHNYTRVRQNQDPAAPPPAKRQKSSIPNSFGPKFSLIKDLEHFIFSDICGQVVKLFVTQYGCDLYLTDYTENKAMFYYAPPEESDPSDREGDTFGYSKPSKKNWPGPYGFLVLHLNVKHPHAGFAAGNLKEGDFVLARNVKMILSKAGSHLEGDMWPDSRNAELVQLRKLSNPDKPEITALLERKEKYWAMRRPLNKSADISDTTKLSKRQKKRKAKQQHREQAAERGKETNFELTTTDPPDLSGSHYHDTNPHIRCNDDVPITPLTDILDPTHTRHINTLPGTDYTYRLPFTNARFRARVRVVDFQPRDLVDFAHPTSALPTASSADDTASLSDHDMDWHSSSTPKHEWHFALQLEDATTTSTTPATAAVRPRLWVQVHHEQAQFLLGRGVEDPEDLRGNRGLLARLREKLFVLWGNLEERTAGQELSNLPFECGVMEYGVPVEDGDEESEEEDEAGVGGRSGDDGAVRLGWRRMYALFGTTVM